MEEKRESSLAGPMADAPVLLTPSGDFKQNIENNKL